MATVAYEYECDKESGFVMDPNEHKRVGYVTALNGLGLSSGIAADLEVSVPFNAGARPTCSLLAYTASSSKSSMGTAKVVGVIETFRWAGGVGEPIQIDFWCSQQNATQLKALQQVTLMTTKVSALGWWIANYDQETKQWFEQSYPLGNTGGSTGAPISGIIGGKSNPSLDVDLNPVPVKDGIDVDVYKISIQVVPAANMAYALQFANSAQLKVVKSWGLVVGGMAATKIGS